MKVVDFGREWSFGAFSESTVQAIAEGDDLAAALKELADYGFAVGAAKQHYKNATDSMATLDAVATWVDDAYASVWDSLSFEER